MQHYLSSNSNVVQFTLDKTEKDKDQQWIYTYENGGYYFKTLYNKGYALDAYSPKSTTGGNADIWPSSASSSDKNAQQIEVVSVGGDYYTISLPAYKIFLSAVVTVSDPTKEPNGTKTGFGTASPGNVRWAPSTNGKDQQWIIKELGSYSYKAPSVSNHTLKNGGIYQIQSFATGKNINLWNGDVSTDSNVVQWTPASRDTAQFWKLIGGTGSTNYLAYAPNQDYYLDAYTPKTTGANADVWKKGDDNAQQLLIVEVSKGKFTISLKNFPNLFLTAIGNKDGTKTGYTSTSDGNIY